MRQAPDALDTFRLRLAVVTAFAFLALKLYKLPAVPRAVLVSAWSFETCVWLWIFALSALAGLARPLARLRVPQGLYALLYLPHFAVSFGTVYFFDDARIGRYTLVDFDSDALTYVRANLQPWRGLGLAATMLAVCGVVALLTRRLRMPGRPGVLLSALLLATIALCFAAARSSAFRTPVWRFAEDVAVVMQYPGVKKPDAELPERSVEQLFNRASLEPVKLEPRFKRVLVFVMEEVMLRHFLDARAALPEQSFFRRIGPHEHFYSNVFTTNMDSWTGALALLSSRFIPYEAYKIPDTERYQVLGNKRSLVDVMRENGFYTVFASSQVLGEGAVHSMRWDEQYLMTEPETKAASLQYLCINPYRFEDSCEDEVLLPRLLALLDSKEKLFWFMPTVWGHQPEYSRRTMKSDIEYYSELLDLLVEHLERQGLANETLIAITADHGSRQRGMELLAMSYQIPLLLYAPGFERYENADLHSQIDFKDILVAALNGTEAELKGAELALFIGQSYLSIVGAVTAQRDFIAVKNRRHAKYTVTHVSYEVPDRFDLPPKGDVTPYEVLQLFGQYRAYFESPDLR